MNTEMDQNDELLAGFIDESINALQDLPLQLGEHRQNPQNTGSINSVFRAVHSIKGNAGFFGLNGIKLFSHSLENTLDDVRNAKLILSEDLERSIVNGFDLLDEMLLRVVDGTIDLELGEYESEALQRVAELAEGCRIGKTDEEILWDQVLELADEIAEAKLEQSENWTERLRNLVAQQTEVDEPKDPIEEPHVPQPIKFLQGKFLASKIDFSQEITPISAIFEAVAEDKYRDELGDEFLKQLAQLAQWAKEHELADFAESLESISEDFRTIHESPLDIDETLLSIIWDRLWVVLDPFRQSEESVPTEEASVEKTATEKPEEKTTTDGNLEATTEANAIKVRMVRVKEERLDGFLDDVSSLFTTCERFKDVHSRLSSGHDLRELVEELRQVNGTFSAQANELQKSVVALRQIPIRGLFAKFPRLARTLASKLNKKIDVHLSGEDTEVDKNLAESLDAPLTHMVRNVADHAIDTPEERVARDIDEVGNMWLHAELTRTHVMITVRDDGRGIDPAKLRSKIVEKGFLTQTQAEALSDQEAIELIFHPGFSTAEQVSDVSGRGVGLDVVRTNLQEHDGDIKIESKVNVGTTFRLEIPIRQAVIVVDGLVLQQGHDKFVVPFEHILEICEFEPNDLKSVHKELVADIRGKPYSAVPLCRLLGIEDEYQSHDQAIRGVLISSSKHGSICLLVDKILGQRKVVVNSLSKIFSGMDKTTGVTQLGGGHLALVLDATDLIKSAKRPQAKRIGIL